MAKLGTITFDGSRGAVLPVKPVMDYYTRLGSSRVVMQRVNQSSPVSSIQLWSLLDDSGEADAIVSKLVALVGKRTSITLSNEITYESVYLVDFSHSVRSGYGSGRILLEVDVQLVNDISNSGDTQ